MSQGWFLRAGTSPFLFGDEINVSLRDMDERAQRNTCRLGNDVAARIGVFSQLPRVNGQHTDHHQGSASSPAQFPGTQTMQNHLRRHLPTSLELSILLQLFYSTILLNYSTSTTLTYLLYSPTLLNPTHHPVSVPSQAIPHAIRSRDQCQDNGRRPHRSVGSTPRISPPEGWRMKPGHDTP